MVVGPVCLAGSFCRRRGCFLQPAIATVLSPVFRPVSLLFSDPGLCVLLRPEVVGPLGWPVSSVAAGTVLAGFRSPTIFPVTGISPEIAILHFFGSSPWVFPFWLLH